LKLKKLPEFSKEEKILERRERLSRGERRQENLPRLLERGGRKRKILS